MYDIFIIKYPKTSTVLRGSRGLIVESRIHNQKVVSSSLRPAGIEGVGSECPALSPPSIP